MWTHVRIFQPLSLLVKLGLPERVTHQVAIWSHSLCGLFCSFSPQAVVNKWVLEFPRIISYILSICFFFYLTALHRRKEEMLAGELRHRGYLKNSEHGFGENKCMYLFYISHLISFWCLKWACAYSSDIWVLWSKALTLFYIIKIKIIFTL